MVYSFLKCTPVLSTSFLSSGGGLHYGGGLCGNEITLKVQFQKIVKFYQTHAQTTRIAHIHLNFSISKNHEDPKMIIDT